jgi:GH15 family glucan-1,4-alpha-glucosidase
MNNAWNKEGKFFGQSYEETDVLDSAVLIMPLVFFMQAVSPQSVGGEQGQVQLTCDV